MEKNFLLQNKTESCQVPCDGNHNETCGGNNFVSIFEIECKFSFNIKSKLKFLN